MGNERVWPVAQIGPGAPADALTLAGGWSWCSAAEVDGRIVPITEMSAPTRAAFEAPRTAIAGMTMDRPRIMGILNVTPDSFSDGGRHAGLADAVRAAQQMVDAGADILDIGGESTRPGAEEVPVPLEISRVVPVVAALRAAGVTVPISVDTRKAPVADAALREGASLINDVSGFTFDPELAPLCAEAGVPVCVMHSVGTPETMQAQARYNNVLGDVQDWLAARIDALEAQGIKRSHVVADPGIGFGKTLQHNLTLLQRIGLFHGLGVPLLVGASRKRFIGTIANVPQADARGPGSVAVALAAVAQGVQIVRVHDVAETAQAVALWQAIRLGKAET